MSRQVPHAEDIATGTPTLGQVPISAGPGLAPAWGAAGGGGGGWTQLAQHTVPAGGGEATVDLPTLSQGYDHLVVVGDNIAFVNDPTTSGQSIYFQVNGWDASDYISVQHKVFNTPLSGVTHLANTVNSEFGLAGWATWASTPDVAGFTLWFPGYSNTTTQRKSYHTEGGWAYSNLGGVVQAGGYIRLAFASHVYIDQLTFFAGNLTGTYLFAPGSRFTVYGVRG
jgi:hypothetical protein